MPRFIKTDLARPSLNFIQWCAGRKDIQKWWCETPWPDETAQIRSNISAGDRFLVGSAQPHRPVQQVGFVHKRIYVAGAVHPGEQFYYDIGGDIGGCSPRMSHRRFVEGNFFVWLPYLEQLLRLGLSLTEAATLVAA